VRDPKPWRTFEERADSIAVSIKGLLRVVRDEERERCAQVAEQARFPYDGPQEQTANATCDRIAAAIRRGAE
jgi:hypothetical protein